ncbi:MAG: DUF2281 domain-containing protein [Anaerolineae bacterium]|nr:DUF2281 domain-containing protein [Anaerolineae bacterium]
MNTMPNPNADYYAKPLETLIQELPADLRSEVRNFVEFLLLKRAQTMKQSLRQDQATSPLRESISRYDAPFAPVAEAEWEALQNVVTESPTAHTQEHVADAWHFLTDHAGSLAAPEDWAAEHDHYLYGTAKQRERDDVA